MHPHSVRSVRRKDRQGMNDSNRTGFILLKSTDKGMNDSNSTGFIKSGRREKIDS